MESLKNILIRLYKPFVLIVTGIFICISYFRIYFGVDLSDEAQYVGSAYLQTVGGKPFINEMFIQQMASLLYAPVIQFYFDNLGSLDGVMLFVRHLYFLMAMVTFAFSFLFWKNKTSTQISMLISCIPLLFIYLSIPSLSYNTMGSHFFGIAMYSGLLSIQRQSKWLIAISALAWSISIVSYPPMALGLFLFILFYFKKNKPLIVTQTLVFVICEGLFFIWLKSFGLENIKRSYILSSQANILGSPLLKLEQAWAAYKLGLPQAWIIGALLVLYVVIPARRAIKNFIFLMLFIFAFLIFSQTHNLHPSPAHIYFATGALITLAYIIYTLIQKQSIASDIAFLGLSCFIIGLLALWTSSNSLYATALCFVFCFQVFVYLFTQYKNAKLAAVPLILILTSISYWSYISSYRDDEFKNLNTKIETGPYKGLITSQAKHDYLEIIQYDLSVLKKKNNSILFYDNFPAGYLMTAMTPKTPCLFMQYMPAAPLLRQYYANFYKDPDNLPDVVYDFKLMFYTSTTVYPLNSGNDNPSNDPMKDFFYKRVDYRLVASTDFYRIFIRQK